MHKDDERPLIYAKTPGHRYKGRTWDEVDPGGKTIQDGASNTPLIYHPETVRERLRAAGEDRAGDRFALRAATT